MDYSKFIRKRSRNIGLTTAHSHLLGKWFAFQVKCQGLEQATTYLKSVGDAIVAYVTGIKIHIPWVRLYNRFPRQVKFLAGYGSDVLLRIAKFARAIRFDEVTPNQIAKVVNGATDTYGGTPEALTNLSNLIKAGIDSTSIRAKSLSLRQPRDPKHIARVFTRTLTSQTKGHKIYSEAPPVMESLDIVVRNPPLFQLPYWTDSFYPLTGSYLKALMEATPVESMGTPVGTIHASQEGGGKLRMYAAPHSIVQCLLLPIHHWIKTIRDTLRTDCTNNQLKGALWAQDILKSGGTIWSVDLRTATCRCPLEPQLEMLRYLGLQEPFIKAILWASRGQWVVGEELKGTGFPDTLTWSVGQPLGIAPSMSMFSLFHNLLLRGLCTVHNIPWDSYRVLGDDLVISDSRLYDEYCSTVTAAGMPISWNKCHISSNYAEFAGASILPDLFLRPGQWAKAVMNNHLSLAAELKTPLYGEVPSRFLRAEKLYLFTLGLFDPPVKEWSKYIKWASNIPIRKLDWFIRGKLYEGGCRMLFSRLGFKPVYVNGRTHYPNHQQYPDLFKRFIRPIIDENQCEPGIDGDWVHPLKEEFKNLPNVSLAYRGALQFNAMCEHDPKVPIDSFLATLSHYLEFDLPDDRVCALYDTMRTRALDLIYGGRSKNLYAKADQTLTNKLLKVIDSV